MMEYELLFHLLSSSKNLGKLVSSNFKSAFLDYDHPGSSAVRSLFEIILTFYLKYKKVINRDHLTKYLDTQSYSDTDKKQILLTFEQVGATPPTHDFDFLCDMLRADYAKHILQQKLGHGVDLLSQNDVPKALRVIEDSVFSAKNVLEGKAVEGTIQESVLERAHRYSDVKRGIIQPGLTSGFPTLDKLTGGMKGGELIVVMAGPREGKSTFLVNVDYYLQMKQAKNVFHVSAENPRIQFERRYDSLHSGLPYASLRDGKLSTQEEQIYKQALGTVANSKGVLYVWDQPVCTPQMIAAKLTELEPKYKFDLIVVDYLSLLRPDNVIDSGWQDVGNIAWHLREIARTINIPVLVAAQIGRKASGSQKTSYDTTDVALSFMIIFHADTVLTMKVANPDVLNSGLGICEINAKIVKCRDGSQGEFVIDASFDRMKMQERAQFVV